MLMEGKRLSDPAYGPVPSWPSRLYTYLVGHPRRKAREVLPLSRTAKIYIWMVAIGGVIALTLTLAASWGEPVGSWWLLGLFAVLVAFDQTVQIPVRSAQGVGQRLEEGLICCMILIFPPAAVILTFTFGAAVALVARRQAPLKGMFNLGQQMIASASAIGIAHAIGVEPGGDFNFVELLGAAAAALTYFLVSITAVSEVLALATRKPFRLELGEDIGLLLLYVANSTSLGILLAIVALAYPWAVPSALIAALVLLRSLLGWLQALKDRQSLSGLVEAADTLHVLANAEEIERELLEITKRMFSCREARLAAEPEEGEELISARMFVGERERWLVATELRGITVFTVADARLLEALAKIGSSALTNAFSFEQVAGERRKLADILNFSSDGIYAADHSECIVSWNPAIAKLTGIEASTALNTSQQDLAAAYPDYADLIRPPDRKGLPQVVRIGEEEGARSFSLASSRTPAGDLIVVVREDTARLELERLGSLRAAEQMRSELVSTVSHELRTPLTSILGFSAFLLAREVNEDDRRQYLQTIHSEAERLSNLLNDFLDLQRVKEGRFLLQVESFDLAALAAEVIALFSQQSDIHSLKLESTGEVAVTGDRERIHQVVANLVSNAIKYSPQGGQVTVRAQVNGDAGRLEVEDQGLGIPAAARSSLFTKFFRVADDSRRTIGGTGLGLALCREIIVAHGGRIDYESEEGTGSRFWFELDLA